MKVFSYRVVGLSMVVGAALALLVMDTSPANHLPGLISSATNELESNLPIVPVPALESNARLKELTRAHITSALPRGTLDSYKTDACIFVGVVALSGGVQQGCIKGSVGIRMPSSGYLMISPGSLRVVELANAQGGWQITARPVNTPGSTTRATTKLVDLKLDALREQIAHSLVSLLRLLNVASESDLSKLKLSGTPSHIVVTWKDGEASSQFFFNRTGLLCDKQTRTTPAGVTVLRYSQYKKVSGVMLPYRIEMEGSSGKVISTEVIQTWTLGAVWPTNFFTPEGFEAFPKNDAERP